MEAVHELEAERDEKGDTKQEEGQPTFSNNACVAHLEIDVQPGVKDAGEQDRDKENGGGGRDRMIELWLWPPAVRATSVMAAFCYLRNVKTST